MQNLKATIEHYRPCNEQEARDRLQMLQFCDAPDILLRQNEEAHFTASAWVVNPARDRVLMLYHNLYQSWSWSGGHADGEADLPAVALREVQEETGLTALTLVSDAIFSLEILSVAAHQKRGKEVPAHRHLNCTYLIEADDTAPLRPKPDENTAVGWFSLEEAVAASSEEQMQPIYRKLNQKLAAR